MTLITERSLNEKEMQDAMSLIMDGKASEDDMASFLTALSERGETVDEITGAAKILRKKASSIKAPDNALDCCGTGGDGTGTYNISTAVALVCAACGVPIAKHGNRAASSKSGAADVLEALDINLDVDKEKLERALKELNFCFLMAPYHHEAVKHVVPVRKKLGFRTIFNLLGPLANPANTQYQLIGVFDKKWLIPMAKTLDRLGTKKAWLVHGGDGLDEITTTSHTDIVILDHGNITQKQLNPEDFGIKRVLAEQLKGGSAEDNAKALTGLLNGDQSAYRDIVLMNSAAVLNIHSNTELLDGINKASEAIDNLSALNVLNKYRDFVS